MEILTVSSPSLWKITPETKEGLSYDPLHLLESKHQYSHQYIQYVGLNGTAYRSRSEHWILHHHQLVAIIVFLYHIYLPALWVQALASLNNLASYSNVLRKLAFIWCTYYLTRIFHVFRLSTCSINLEIFKEGYEMSEIPKHALHFLSS